MILQNVEVQKIIPLISKTWLFNSLWQLKGDKVLGEEVLKKYVADIDKYGFEPKVIYEVFAANYKQGILTIDNSHKIKLNHTILEKMLSKKNGKKPEEIKNIALQCVTIGDNITALSDVNFKEANYSEYFYLYGLAAALTEACAEYVNIEICRQEGVDKESSLRMSAGYPVWPDIKDQSEIATILDINKIGVSISESNQLIPEFSTTAMVLL